MDEKKLKMLRKKHMILINLMALVGFGILMLMLYNGLTIRVMWIGLIILTSFQTLILYKKDMPLMALISRDWHELHEYEKIRLGGEWKKQKKMQITSQILLVIVGMFNAIVAGPNNKMLLEGENANLFYLLLFAILIVLINASTFFHYKKIDKNENLDGYTQSMFNFSILTALIFFIIVFAGMLFFLF